VSALAATYGVLQPWWPKLSVGDRCVCVSGAGAGELNELTERAAAAADWQEVSTEFLKGKEPAAHFRQLRSAWWDPAEAEVYRALHSVDVRTIDETQLG